MIKVSDRLEICFDTNEIISMDDRNTPKRTKVEPRIMHVLKILVNNSPKVVLRDQLISEVWDNYGGADDALNQSISHLRKLLKDTNKEKRIIETVVKKGYRFASEIEINDINPNEARGKSKRFSFWPWLITLILISSILIYNMVGSKESFVPTAPLDNGSVSDSTLAPPDVNE